MKFIYKYANTEEKSKNGREYKEGKEIGKVCVSVYDYVRIQCRKHIFTSYMYGSTQRYS